MANPAVVVEYKADMKDIKSKLAELEGGLKKTEQAGNDSAEHISKGFEGTFNSLEKGFERVAERMLEVFAIEKVIEFGKASIEAYGEAAGGEAKLLNALKGRTDVQERLLDQAKEIQKNTTIQDDAIVSQQAFLAAQGRTEDQIKKTIAAAVQLSAVTGKDLNTSVMTLDATYEGNIGRLGKLDAGFKGLTKTQLENGAAVDLVLDKYKGFAETAAQVGTGPLEQFKNVVNDLQENLGHLLVSGLLPVVSGLSAAVKWFTAITGPIETAQQKAAHLTEAADKQNEAFEALNSTVTPLLERYDELKGKASLNADEQEELRKIIKKVGDEIPGAIKQFDAYGNALDINSKKAKERIEQDKLAAQGANRAAIAAQQKEVGVLNESIQNLQEKLSTVGSKFKDPVNGLFSDEAITKARQDLANYQAQLEKARKEINRLQGGELDKKGADKPAPKIFDDTTIAGLKEHIADVTATLDTAKIKSDEYNKALKQQKQLQDELTIAQGKQTEAQKKAAEEKKKQIELTDKLNLQIKEEQGKGEDDPVKRLEGEKQAAIAKVDIEFKALAKTRENLDKIEQLKLLIVRDFNQKEFDANVEAGNKQTEQERQQSERDIAARKDAYQYDLQQIQKTTGLKELALANEFANGTISKAKYEKQLQSTQLNSLKEQLAAAKANGQETLGIEKQIVDEKLKLAQQEAAYKKQIEQESVALTEKIIDGVFQLQKAKNSEQQNDVQLQYDKDARALETQLQQKRISQQKYDKEKLALDDAMHRKEAELKTKQFNQDKIASIIKATIAGAIAVNEALAIPPPAGEILAAIRAAAVATEIALIVSQPTPKFYAKGTRFVDGPTGIDKVPAMLTRGEAVMPVEVNKKYGYSLDAMLQGTYDHQLNNKLMKAFERGAQYRHVIEMKKANSGSDMLQAMQIMGGYDKTQQQRHEDYLKKIEFNGRNQKTIIIDNTKKSRI